MPTGRSLGSPASAERPVLSHAREVADGTCVQVTMVARGILGGERPKRHQKSRRSSNLLCTYVGIHSAFFPLCTIKYFAPEYIGSNNRKWLERISFYPMLTWLPARPADGFFCVLPLYSNHHSDLHLKFWHFRFKIILLFQRLSEGVLKWLSCAVVLIPERRLFYIVPTQPIPCAVMIDAAVMIAFSWYSTLWYR